MKLKLLVLGLVLTLLLVGILTAQSPIEIKTAYCEDGTCYIEGMDYSYPDDKIASKEMLVRGVATHINRLDFVEAGIIKEKPDCYEKYLDMLNEDEQEAFLKVAESIRQHNNTDVWPGGCWYQYAESRKYDRVCNYLNYIYYYDCISPKSKELSDLIVFERGFRDLQ